MFRQFSSYEDQLEDFVNGFSFTISKMGAKITNGNTFMHKNLQFLSVIVDKQQLINRPTHIKLRKECPHSSPKEEPTFKFSPIKIPKPILFWTQKNEAFSRHNIVLPFGDYDKIVIGDQDAFSMTFVSLQLALVETVTVFEDFYCWG